MKPTLLIDVPKSSPSRLQRLRAFKARHGIKTHRGAGMSRKEDPWIACLMPVARKFGYGVTEASDLFDCVAKVGRLLEESDTMVYGQTEAKAVRTLCEKNGIIFEP